MTLKLKEDITIGYLLERVYSLDTIYLHVYYKIRVFLIEIIVH